MDARRARVLSWAGRDVGSLDELHGFESPMRACVRYTAVCPGFCPRCRSRYVGFAKW